VPGGIERQANSVFLTGFHVGLCGRGSFLIRKQARERLTRLVDAHANHPRVSAEEGAPEQAFGPTPNITTLERRKEIGRHLGRGGDLRQGDALALANRFQRKTKLLSRRGWTLAMQGHPIENPWGGCPAREQFGCQCATRVTPTCEDVDQVKET